MLDKPLIGIVKRCENNYIKTNNSIINAIEKCGGIPITIISYETVELCDGIILPGGTDITDFDKNICKYAIENDIPILGICLGMQVMASLFEDNLERIDNHNKKEKYVHKIKTIKGSILDDIIGESYVNSRHNEHVINSGIYNVTAYIDNSIEGIEYIDNRFNVGVQWHPEDMIEYDKKNIT